MSATVSLTVSSTWRLLMTSVAMVTHGIFSVYNEMCHHLETVFGVTKPHRGARCTLSAGQINGF